MMRQVLRAVRMVVLTTLTVLALTSGILGTLSYVGQVDLATGSTVTSLRSPDSRVWSLVVLRGSFIVRDEQPWVATTPPPKYANGHRWCGYDVFPQGFRLPSETANRPGLTRRYF